MPIPTVEDRLDTLFAGRYQLEAVLGTGGTGVVYSARHSWTGKPVAVKLLKPHLASDLSLVRRFLQEARAAAEVAHPNVVQILDLGAEPDGTVFIAMEQLEGTSLQERLAGDATLDLEETLRVLVPIMDALAHAHAAGIVHRDLKPANVLLHRGVGAHVTPKLLDFGMSKILDPEWGRATQSGVVVGTPFYMSPEQAEGAKDQDAQCDVWALGVVFHRCLAGKLPFTAESAPALLLKLVRESAPSLGDVADVPAPIAAVIDRALIADREERWPDVASMIEALRGACLEAIVPFPRLPSADPMPAPPAFDPGPRRDAKRRRWWPAAVAGAIVIAAAAWWAFGDTDPTVVEADTGSAPEAATESAAETETETETAAETETETATETATETVARSDTETTTVIHRGARGDGGAVDVAAGRAPGDLAGVGVRALGGTLAALLLLASVARAQEGDARALFERGVELADEERWGEAVEYFRRSRALEPRAVTVFNLAAALMRLGRPTAALEALEDYAQLAGEDDPRREDARELSEVALAAVAHLTLTVEPPGARLRVDGELAAGEGATRELRLDPGEHRLSLEAEGHLPESLVVALLDGERAARSVALALRTEPTGPARLRVTSDRADAVILVDDREVGRGTYLAELEPGDHVVEVRAEGFEPFRRSFTLGAAERRDVQAALAPIESTPLVEEPALWITVSGVVLAGVAAGIAIAALSGTDAPYGGSTGVVIFGLSGRF